MIMPVPMAERSEARTAFGRSNTGIVGSNPTRGMDEFGFFCVVLSCGWVEALRRIDPPSKEPYQLSNRCTSFRKINSELEQANRPNPWKDDDDMMIIKWITLNR
jgi:hypothetical protein